ARPARQAGAARRATEGGAEARDRRCGGTAGRRPGRCGGLGHAAGWGGRGGAGPGRARDRLSGGCGAAAGRARARPRPRRIPRAGRGGSADGRARGVPRSRRRRIVTWSDPSFDAIASIIRERTGLVFPPSRREEIERALARALPHRRDPDHIRTLLETNDEVKDALIAELTVGESYFLRDTGQFTLLRSLLPQLAELRGTLPVRVWSAGCATGEEPYSVAILSEQLGLGDRVSILGTDISRARLAHARRGVYRPWSLRGVAGDVIARFFDRRGDVYHVRPQVRERVEFRYLNLAEDRFPSLTAGLWGMDVILCRNVLIYFDRETVTRVARGLVATLSDDGWLVLGASDPAIGELVDVEVHVTPGGIAYRRRGAPELAAQAPFIAAA